MVVAEDTVIISKNLWEQNMRESQYLRAKIKLNEIHWDIMEMINGGEKIHLIYSIKY